MDGIPRLEFECRLSTSSEWHLIEGTLLIKKDIEKAGVKLNATSGLPGYQTKGAWRIKGRGPIPPSVQIIPQKWMVATQRLWMSDVKGVEGSFYSISPFQILLPGVARGDFGIHFDANVPGSSGCIVIRQQDHWDLFRKEIAEFRLDGIQQLPLFVSYD